MAARVIVALLSVLSLATASPVGDAVAALPLLDDQEALGALDPQEHLESLGAFLGKNNGEEAALTEGRDVDEMMCGFQTIVADFGDAAPIFFEKFPEGFFKALQDASASLDRCTTSGIGDLVSLLGTAMQSCCR